MVGAYRGYKPSRRGVAQLADPNTGMPPPEEVPADARPGVEAIPEEDEEAIGASRPGDARISDDYAMALMVSSTWMNAAVLAAVLPPTGSLLMPYPQPVVDDALPPHTVASNWEAYRRVFADEIAGDVRAHTRPILRRHPPHDLQPAHEAGFGGPMPSLATTFRCRPATRPTTKAFPVLSRSVDDPAPTKPEALTCAVCMEARVGVVLGPCGHACACRSCARMLEKKAKPYFFPCPLCRATVESWLPVYFG